MASFILIYIQYEFFFRLVWRQPLTRFFFNLFPSSWRLVFVFVFCCFLTSIVVTYSPYYVTAIWRGWLLLSVVCWNKSIIAKSRSFDFSSNYTHTHTHTHTHTYIYIYIYIYIYKGLWFLQADLVIYIYI